MSLFQHSSKQRQGLLFKQLPISITRHSSQAPCSWGYEDEETRAACIGCFTQPCRTFNAAENSVPAGIDMVRDINSDVCPVDAITWCSDTNTPKIDEDRCIGCGLCVARCPVGALYLSEGKPALETPSTLTKSKLKVIEQAEAPAQAYQLEALPKVEYLEPVADDTSVVSVTHKLTIVHDQSKVVSRLSRNLLVSLGLKAALGREGNVHHRMDGFFTFQENVGGPLEVEPGQDSLEALRAVLDSLAILHSQFSWPLSHLKPLVIYVSLPTERQEYWSVTRDVHEVLELRIPSMTVGALLLFVWNGVKLTAETLDKIAESTGAKTIRQVVADTLEREINIPMKELGILEPER